MPSNCYQQAQLTQMRRLWIKSHPAIATQKDKVVLGCKRKRDPDTEKENKLSEAKKQRIEMRKQTSQQQFYVDKLRLKA